MESQELEDNSDKRESSGAESGREEQTSEFEEEAEEDMTGNAEFAAEHNVEIEGAVNENGDRMVVADMGSENDSMSVI